jgi:hypothetical protein
MNRNRKFLVVALAALLLAGAYGLGSYITTAQMGMPSQSQTADPMARMATALERMGVAMERMGGMNSGGMGMMGQMGQMGSMMQEMQSMMEQMQSHMGQMMQSCQPMMGMAGPMAPAQQTAPATQLTTEAALTRTTTGAAVMVAAAFVNPLLKSEEVAGQLVFKIVLDTHSVDLMQYDLTKLAVLRNSEGLIVDAGFLWEPEEESSHHRTGLLKIHATIAGKPVITQDTAYIELELVDVGIPSRLYKWEGAVLSQANC